MKKERLYYLDIIKMIAVLGVVTCHFSMNAQWMDIQLDTTILPYHIFGVYIGDYGVSLFFIVSGAALMYTYDKESTLKKYFIKRFIGIFPMFWIAYIIGFLYTFYVNGGLNESIPKWKIILSILGMDGYIMTLGLGANFYILGEWFLGCLICLYLCFPILKKWIEKRPIILGIGIMLMYIILVYYFHNFAIRENIFLIRIPEFVFGMYFIKYMKRVNVTTFIISVIILALNTVVNMSFTPKSFTVTSVGIATFCVCTFVFSKYRNGVLNSIAQFVGKYSYAIYLTHHVIIKEVLKGFSGTSATRVETYLLYLICWLITIVISIGIYNLSGQIMKRMRLIILNNKNLSTE